MGQSNITSTPLLTLPYQRDRLQQYQKRITVLTSRETEIARECLRRNDKARALLALRRKKYQESLLAKTDAQLASLETLTQDVEFALVQRDVLFGLQQGTKVLKDIHKEMGGIEGVEKLLEDSAEAQGYAKEVSDMLAGRMSNQDEDEVEDELAELERQVAGIDKLPDAPSKALEREETPKERRERRAREQLETQAAQAEPEPEPEPMLA
ncbi:Snf7-domain-containing protein [Trichodelitschia bisporula]|uniref:Snf7-domain-containing protein n=1 Tax=Trichodelitschia bisporula TaxID=703511 RepID=A0A6G1I671_9PEZI|nr:Snf7-domain-containing protein [Trichodelitschia bisporula]